MTRDLIWSFQVDIPIYSMVSPKLHHPKLSILLLAEDQNTNLKVYCHIIVMNLLQVGWTLNSRFRFCNQFWRRKWLFLLVQQNISPKNSVMGYVTGMDAIWFPFSIIYSAYRVERLSSHVIELVFLRKQTWFVKKKFWSPVRVSELATARHYAHNDPW